MNEIIKTKQEQTTDFKKPADIVKAKVCKSLENLLLKGFVITIQEAAV